MAQQYSLFLLVLGIFISVLLARQRMKRPSSLPLPPGPPALPLIGNVLNVPTNGAPGFRDLCTKYGDVVHLEIPGKAVVVLGSQEAASELLEKRSANYSDRPCSPMVDIAGFGWSFAFREYGPFWRRGRRAFHQFFNQTAVQKYIPDQRLEAHRLVIRLIDNPEAFIHHIRHMFGSSIMRVVYGIEVDEDSVDYLQMAEDTVAIISEVFLPGKYIIELLPWLRYFPSWVPGATVKRAGVTWRSVVQKLVEEPWRSVMAAMKDGTARPSMTTSLIADLAQPVGETNDTVSEVEESYRGTAATAYAAGGDTILTNVMVFFLAMANNPQVLKKAQAELDAVVGPHRLPDFEDMKSLPYICALVKELLRWHVVAPLGFPHRSVADDEYNGYFIPKGTILIANIWANSRDPNVYRDPEAFMPERFLKDGELDPDVRDPLTFAFGYGRRICPGRHYATSMLFIVVTTVLHTLSITPPLDKDGNTVHLEGKVMPGLVACLEPFECVIKPRSEAAVKLIRQAVATL